MAPAYFPRRLICLLLACGSQIGYAADPAHAPVIYSQPALESPVRGDPDDLLLLPGGGFSTNDTVVYARVEDTTALVALPSRSPGASDESQGVAAVVSYWNVPYSLTVRLPSVMRAGQSYALWVVNSQGRFSNGVLINDARPLWLTPGEVFATADMAQLDRLVKIVGRNLQAEPGAVTRVRLLGPETVILPAMAIKGDLPAVARYAAVIRLPKRLAVGDYRIEITRDRRSWVPLEGQRLHVRPDPPIARRFDVSAAANGGCRPDDGVDDTPCVVRAIHAAQEAGGGTVVLGAGVWDLIEAPRPGISGVNGILVPPHVDIVGQGAKVTRVVRHEGWIAGGSNSIFTLLGHNLVRGIKFQDMHRFEPQDPPRPVFQLGMRQDASVPSVDEVVITEDIFDRVYEAIVDVGVPIEHLLVTHNEFGAYFVALELPGDRFNTDEPFRIDDSVIAFNRFEPSSYLDLENQTGVVATEIGASLRLDFSHNVADGAALDYLYRPDDARGWRAAFFWNMNNNQEMLLVSSNSASCTGDKIGDGEAFAYDNNANTFGFDGMQEVTGAGAAEIAMPGPLLQRQNGRDIQPSTYYIGHWVQIAEGPGLGQIRKIRSYRIDAATGAVTFTVTPAWDVPPVPGLSRASVAREFWQAYTVGNSVDHRQPLCAKSNRGRPKGGVIGLWAQTADSAVEGNRQYDTDGILLQQAYSATDPTCKTCEPATNFQDFVEIRDNTVDGEYRWDSACSLSGILGSYAASPTSRSPPPILSYGVSIAHNTIIHADGDRGGAIDYLSTWYKGPPPYRWPLVDNLLVHHNTLRDIDGAPPREECGYRQPARIGIKLDGPDNVWRSVLYANTCERVSIPLSDLGSETVRVCPDKANAASCECTQGGSNDRGAVPARRPGGSTQ